MERMLKGKMREKLFALVPLKGVPLTHDQLFHSISSRAWLCDVWGLAGAFAQVQA